MATATLNIKVSPRRMLSEREAAEYCGLQAKRFRVDCRVAPVEMPGGRRLYDIRDLDFWLDALKSDQPNDDDTIVERLG